MLGQRDRQTARLGQRDRQAQTVWDREIDIHRQTGWYREIDKLAGRQTGRQAEPCGMRHYRSPMW